MTVAVTTFVATVAVTTFVATVAVTTFAVIVPMVTFVPMVGRFLFVTRRFFLRMATTPTLAHTVFAVVVLVEARAATVSTAEGEIAAAGDRDGTAGTDAEYRSRKDCRHT